MAVAGIIFALVALISWGLGDFFIQKIARKTGIINALFYITAVAGIVLLPFVWGDLPNVSLRSWTILGFSGVITFITALIQFQALKVGKLAVIEPIISLELPLTVIIAALIGREHLGIIAYALIAIVFLGIFLAVIPHQGIIKNYITRLEKGTLLALLGAVGMAVTNFVIGYGSQETTPLLAIWGTHTVIAVLCFAYLLMRGEVRSLIRNVIQNPGTIIAESIFDNAAWIAYAFAVIYIPISIAITISEGYIILAVLLGIIINKEKLRNHQTMGVVLAIIGVILLSVFAK